MSNPIWFDLGDDAGVLEFSERPEGRAFELHLVAQSDGARSVAWWEREDGTWLGAADVGTC